MEFFLSEKYISKCIIYSKRFVKHLLCMKDKRVSKVNITSALIGFMPNEETVIFLKNNLTSTIDIWQPNSFLSITFAGSGVRPLTWLSFPLRQHIVIHHKVNNVICRCSLIFEFILTTCLILFVHHNTSFVRYCLWEFSFIPWYGTK